MTESLPTISLCMIMKNEGHCLETCLKSVRSLVSEIIIVDTGSTDNSKEIAAKYNAKVFSFDWCNDFAAARNFSLSKASGDWILVLDADELIAEKDLESFKSLISNRTICTEFLQRHYSDDCRISKFTACQKEFPELEKNYLGYFESACCRLFPNREGLEFTGRIHELVEQSIFKRQDIKIIRTEIRIHHYGHTPEIKELKEKSSLYTPLGEEKIKDKPKDWKGFFELGVEYNQTGKYQEAARAFLASVELRDDYIDTWTNMGYTFMEIGMYKEAEDSLIKAIKLSPQSSEAYCNLGVVFMRQRMFDKAEAALKYAYELQPTYLNAICNLGETYAWQNRLSEGAFFYRKALSISPGLPRALGELGALFLSVGKLKEAEQFLRDALQRDPNYKNAQLNLNELLKISQAQVADPSTDKATLVS